MIVCICNNINEKTLVEIVRKTKVISIMELQEHVKICDQCTFCAEKISDIIFENLDH